jgi:MFS family permease
MLFLLNTGSTTVGSFLIVFARDQGVTGNIGLYFLVSASTMLVTRPIIGRLTDRFGLVKVVIPALFCNVLSFFVISYSGTLLSFMFAAFISAFGYGACQPAMQALSMKTVPNERRGAASSTNFIGMDLGNLLGPTMGGIVAQALGYDVMWRTMAVPFLVGISLLITFRKLFTRIEQDFTAKQPS